MQSPPCSRWQGERKDRTTHAEEAPRRPETGPDSPQSAALGRVRHRRRAARLPRLSSVRGRAPPVLDGGPVLAPDLRAEGGRSRGGRVARAPPPAGARGRVARLV